MSPSSAPLFTRDPDASSASYQPTPSELVAAVTSLMEERADLSGDSTERLADLMRRFALFAEEGRGIGLAAAVSGGIAEGFVRARSRGGSLPAGATMHLRRAAVRLLFSEGRKLGLVSHDPTMDLALPARSSLRTRPLTDDEVALCRSYSVRTPTETRQPAAWALAEATARSAEIALVQIQDLDLDRTRVWIPGSTKTDARWGVLSEWGRAQIQRRTNALAESRETRLVCPSAKEGPSGTSSASIAIGDTLRRAGLHAEPDVRPGSVAAWAGARALAEGMSIDRVALMLGVRSLDRAAALIGFEWRGITR